MTQELAVKVHEIATDGLPDMDQLTGRVAFIFDGCIVSGWPLTPYADFIETYRKAGVDHDGVLWEGNTDVSHNRPFYGVTHWVEFPAPLWEVEA
jgi:hypothetical protein